MKILMRYHTFVLCLYCFNAGYLTNAVIRRVSQPVWPADTKYPITLLGLMIFCIVMQVIVLSINEKKSDETPT